MLYIIIGAIEILTWYCIISFVVMFYFIYVTERADRATRKSGKHVAKTPFGYIVFAGAAWIIIMPYYIWLSWKFRKK